jgi:ABC-type phosphate transport system permease subunit
MYYAEERHPMEKQSQFLILFSGFLGLSLAILTARPKQIADIVIGTLAGLFGCMFLAPALAEVITNFSVAFPSFSWLNAAPGSSLFMAIVGLGGMLGFQIVTAVKADFVIWVKQFAKSKLKIKDAGHDTGADR